jgi:hypothetical protein
MRTRRPDRRRTGTCVRAHERGPVLRLVVHTAHLAPGAGIVSTYLLQGALISAMGGLIGSMIFGWYLAIMCQLFGVHRNEATATQANRHWKSFLRLRIGVGGELTIHPAATTRAAASRSRATAGRTTRSIATSSRRSARARGSRSAERRHPLRADSRAQERGHRARAGIQPLRRAGSIMRPGSSTSPGSISGREREGSA